MQIYRVLRRLSTGHEKGAIILETELEERAAAILLRRGALAVASTPPLAELPGWKVRAAGLGEIGIMTIEQLLSAQVEEVMSRFNLGKASTVARWKREALSWLEAPARRNCGRC